MGKKNEKLPFKVIKGGLVPADSYVSSRLRQRGYKVNDIVFAVITKPRNPKYHRLAHRIGTLCVEHLAGFEELNAHTAIKRLQWESGCGCDEIGALIPNVGITQIRIPLSLSFESMDQGVFEEVIKGLCRHISTTYWPDLSPIQVAEMADSMPDQI
jgi:hypothetical protein